MTDAEFDGYRQSYRFTAVEDKLREIRAYVNGAYKDVSWRDREKLIHRLAEDALSLVHEIEDHTPGLYRSPIGTLEVKKQRPEV